MKKRHIKDQRNIALKALAFYARGKTDGGQQAAEAVRQVEQVKHGKPISHAIANTANARRKKMRRSTPAALA